METFSIYGYDMQGYYTNTLVTNKYEGIPSGYTRVEIPLVSEGSFLKFNGSQWLEVSKKVLFEAVPQSITVRQAREQLIRIGLLSKVQSEIDKITDISQREIVQNYWEYSMDFKRDNDVLISLAYSLGLSDADIDNLFIEASKL